MKYILFDRTFLREMGEDVLRWPARKSGPPSGRIYENCCMYMIEDVVHIIMQCPMFIHEQTTMFNEISRSCPMIERKFYETLDMTLARLRGGSIHDVDQDELILISVTIYITVFVSVLSKHMILGQ